MDNRGLLEAKDSERKCQIAGCNDLTVGARTSLCRKHRNNKYKQNYKKKKRKAQGAEDKKGALENQLAEEKYHLEQKYASMLQQVLVQKRLDLLQSESVINLLRDHQQKVRESKQKEVAESKNGSQVAKESELLATKTEPQDVPATGHYAKGLQSPSKQCSNSKTSNKSGQLSSTSLCALQSAKPKSSTKTMNKCTTAKPSLQNSEEIIPPGDLSDFIGLEGNLLEGQNMSPFDSAVARMQPSHADMGRGNGQISHQEGSGKQGDCNTQQRQQRLQQQLQKQHQRPSQHKTQTQNKQSRASKKQQQQQEMKIQQQQQQYIQQQQVQHMQQQRLQQQQLLQQHLQRQQQQQRRHQQQQQQQQLHQQQRLEQSCVTANNPIQLKQALFSTELSIGTLPSSSNNTQTRTNTTHVSGTRPILPRTPITNNQQLRTRIRPEAVPIAPATPTHRRIVPLMPSVSNADERLPVITAVMSGQGAPTVMPHTSSAVVNGNLTDPAAFSVAHAPQQGFSQDHGISTITSMSNGAMDFLLQNVAEFEAHSNGLVSSNQSWSNQLKSTNQDQFLLQVLQDVKNSNFDMNALNNPDSQSQHELSGTWSL